MILCLSLSETDGLELTLIRKIHRDLNNSVSIKCYARDLSICTVAICFSFFFLFFFVEIWKAASRFRFVVRLDTDLPNFHKITIVLRHFDRVYRTEGTEPVTVKFNREIFFFFFSFLVNE